MLEIKEVKKSYGEFQLDCSLNVEKGRITGLVGENGAGKSTVFKAVLGLISYDGGEIKIMGKTPEQLGEKEKEKLDQQPEWQEKPGVWENGVYRECFSQIKTAVR